jgi:hypothetical protein
MKSVFEDEGFEFDRRLLLGSAYRGLSDVGEVLVTLEKVTDGDRESWVREFGALADRVNGEADTQLAAGHAISARATYLRASTYYASASAYAPGTSDPGRYDTLWERHRACWDAAVKLFEPPVETVRIPYEGTALEGYFFHARSPRGRGAATDRRPVIILNNGSDGPVSDMWGFGAAAALDRGWNAVTFDGPGQNAALHRQHLYFRADWETVITPVVDWLIARPDVDADRIALMGASQGGYWVPRAAAFEHRLAAAVADPGVMRVAGSWLSHLPDVMTDLLGKGDKKDFDAFMEAGLKDDPTQAAVLKWRMAPYGTDSFYDAYQMAMSMSLDADILGKITCPLLLTAPDHEQFWPGDSEEMHRLVPSSTVVRFAAEEGADWHCEPAAQSLRQERIFNWLEDALG